MADTSEISVEELKQRLEKREEFFFINLHHHNHRDWSLMKARGALVVDDDEVGKHLEEIPRNRPVIVYATCTGDEAAFKVAHELQNNGWTDVHPLTGGFAAYVGAGLPVEPSKETTQARKTMLL